MSDLSLSFFFLEKITVIKILNMVFLTSGRENLLCSQNVKETCDPHASGLDPHASGENLGQRGE